MATTISSKTDIVTYVQNNHPDFVSHDLDEDLVCEIMLADHPPYGTDWSAWLEENVPGLRVRIGGED